MNDKSQIPFPQEPLWRDTLDIIVGAPDGNLLTESTAIRGMLRFNSAETRERYAAAIVARFRRLPAEYLKGLVDLARTETPIHIIEQIWRILFCLAEPLVAKAYVEIVWPREPGSPLTREEVRSYVESIFPQESSKLNVRLISCLNNAGYLVPQGIKSLTVVGFGNLEEALVLSTHLLLAQSPRTVRLAEMESNDYWKFLGYRRFDHVKVALRGAEAKGLLMRYAVVDHLEQITTRYPWQELLAAWRQVR